MRIRIIALLLALLGATTPAFAQDDISISTGIVGGGKYLGAKTADNQTTVPMAGVDSNGNSMLNAMSGKVAGLSIAKTPIAQAVAGGLELPVAGTGIEFTAYVPTFAATPVAGTNDLKPGLNVVPTAAASTAACFPAVLTPGVEFVILNPQAAAVRAKACGTPGVNGGAAGTYVTVAVQSRVTCVATSATNLQCSSEVVPTPAGP